MTRSLLQRWRKLDDQGRQQVSLLFVCSGYTLHYLVYCILQPFFIEDAAITFAYAEIWRRVRLGAFSWCRAGGGLFQPPLDVLDRWLVWSRDLGVDLG